MVIERPSSDHVSVVYVVVNVRGTVVTGGDSTSTSGLAVGGRFVDARAVTRICAIDPREPLVAVIFEVQRASYRIEADLIGFDGIPPLHDTVDIDRLAVHPDRHRKGIGAALLRQVHVLEATATAFVVPPGR